jgi:hypothetical protein
MPKHVLLKCSFYSNIHREMLTKIRIRNIKDLEDPKNQKITGNLRIRLPRRLDYATLVLELKMGCYMAKVLIKTGLLN